MARQLVDELLAFAAADGGYRAVYLHTDPAVTGAEPFWRSLAKIVHDERADAGAGRGSCTSTCRWCEGGQSMEMIIM
ncbi:hypothetical protein LV779_37450 [Streptomyces thinghirensis]|nr:hypothetical protein [Streptomyces thinghirensis]